MVIPKKLDLTYLPAEYPVHYVALTHGEIRHLWIAEIIRLRGRRMDPVFPDHLYQIRIIRRDLLFVEDLQLLLHREDNVLVVPVLSLQAEFVLVEIDRVIQMFVSLLVAGHDLSQDRIQIVQPHGEGIGIPRCFYLLQNERIDALEHPSGAVILGVLMEDEVNPVEEADDRQAGEHAFPDLTATRHPPLTWQGRLQGQPLLGLDLQIQDELGMPGSTVVRPQRGRRRGFPVWILRLRDGAGIPLTRQLDEVIYLDVVLETAIREICRFVPESPVYVLIAAVICCQPADMSGLATVLINNPRDSHRPW